MSISIGGLTAVMYTDTFQTAVMVVGSAVVMITSKEHYRYESPRGKTNKMTCAPSEDSDQPGHPSSLIRVFAVRMKKLWVLSYPQSAQ